MSFTIRHITFFPLCLMLMACGTAENDAELLRGVLQPDAPRFHPRATALAQVRPIPPRLEVSFPTRDLTGVMLLETQRNGIETWLSADGGSITLEDGFLLSAKGFGTGLTASDVSQGKALILAGQPGFTDRFHSFLQGNDQIVHRAFKCEITRVGTETIFLTGIPTTVRRIEEACQGLEFGFSNTYWLDAKSPKIIQSSQWTGDFLGNLTLKVVLE